MLLYFAAQHAGAPDAQALNLDVLAAHAASLDPGVTRLAGGLLLIGYGAKAGLFPFHTWLADAHSQAPAPVSALMSGVLLSVAFSVLLRIKPIVDAATGPAFLRTGLVVLGLATLLVAALMLTVTGDIKRMLAYSSMENMGLIAIAAAAGTSWRSRPCCCMCSHTASARRCCSSRADSCRSRTAPPPSPTSPASCGAPGWSAARSRSG